MKETGRRLHLDAIDYTPEMLNMADCAGQATQAIRNAMPLLSAIDRNVDQLQCMQEQVREAEGRADDLMSAGLQTLFTGTASAGTKLTVEKVYDLIESVVDRCEDVADVIEGIMVEQA
ncbi:DUF47 family protein (plasmid) [Lichenicola cladoniae]|uniref:DUF47 family protein n=1 Tax=Lichenicola cladoniae TaxID=1484109 RepID=A0A6M8HZP8_9PROT|nr:DUF47 family protein [Lichenicola cladoniae]NPD70014.1 DUF47 family protein [Acetobacteraceae bacterium]QKE93635.1 DUF47 family protein [Lichenicola cladoniae]